MHSGTYIPARVEVGDVLDIQKEQEHGNAMIKDVSAFLNRGQEGFRNAPSSEGVLHYLAFRACAPISDQLP